MAATSCLAALCLEFNSNPRLLAANALDLYKGMSEPMPCSDALQGFRQSVCAVVCSQKALALFLMPRRWDEACLELVRAYHYILDLPSDDVVPLDQKESDAAEELAKALQCYKNNEDLKIKGLESRHLAKGSRRPSGDSKTAISYVENAL